jgi:hypothetical protein
VNDCVCNGRHICVWFYGGKRNVGNVTFSFVKDYKHIWKRCMFSCIKMVNMYLKLCLNIFYQLEAFLQVSGSQMRTLHSSIIILFIIWFMGCSWSADTSANLAMWALKTLWISVPPNVGILLGLHGLAGWGNLQKSFHCSRSKLLPTVIQRAIDLSQSETPLYLQCSQLWPVISTIHWP